MTEHQFKTLEAHLANIAKAVYFICFILAFWVILLGSMSIFSKLS